jgi:hypothetical protein
MINRVAKLFALAATSMPCAALAVGMPDASPVKAALDSSRLVSDDELSEMRGGFFTAAGAQFDFGASIQTLVNGKLALQTNLQWTPSGAVTQQLQGLQSLGSSIQAQVVSDLAKAGIATPGAAMQTASNAVATVPTSNTPATSMPATQPAASAPASSTPVTAGPVTAGPVAAANAPAAPATSAPAAATPAPATTPVPATTPASTLSTAPVTSVSDVATITGIEIPGATGGSTQVFANFGAGQIQNVILNSASGQTITQNTNVTLTIYNFAAWQQQVAQHMLSARLANDMLAASGISAGH